MKAVLIKLFLFLLLPWFVLSCDSSVMGSDAHVLIVSMGSNFTVTYSKNKGTNMNAVGTLTGDVAIWGVDLVSVEELDITATAMDTNAQDLHIYVYMNGKLEIDSRAHNTSPPTNPLEAKIDYPVPDQY